ncbi:MAG: hypothetical protein KF829_01015 [Ferruginibacter sp.]|nr:hypothetical protein [Ferruginibacter sp.]
MRKRNIIPYSIYLLVAILFLAFPDTMSKYLPRYILYLLGLISLLIVATFYILAKIKKPKTKR